MVWYGVYLFNISVHFILHKITQDAEREMHEVQYSVGPCVISCQMFVKSEFPLDSALVCDSDKKKIGWNFFRNL